MRPVLQQGAKQKEAEQQADPQDCSCCPQARCVKAKDESSDPPRKGRVFSCSLLMPPLIR